VQGNGNEGPSSLGIEIESGKLIINRNSQLFIEIRIKIA